MFRSKKFSGWRKNKRPREGQSFARGCRCLSDHYHRSGLEGRVCDELRLRQIAGDIKDYRVEVTIPLELAGVKLGTYRIDFLVEHNDGVMEYVEAKGIEFATWKNKWRILEGMLRGNPLAQMTVIKK